METKKFGRYEIKAEIGRGGMATVYHAHDPLFDREVALKVLPREMLHDPQFRTRFEREAKTIAMLEHPAIVPVYDFGEEDGQPFFVMRYMTGGSLADKMKNGPLPVQEVAHLMTRLAPALDEAHAKGIIHRDLKPGNILFDQYGEPYISDFGIAKITEAQTNVTGSAIVGTPAYMSPEQGRGESIDGRSDIYGLGVILFELLTGQQPYQGDTPMSVVIKHITEPVPHILDVKPDLPTAVESVIEKAMAKDRNERFQAVKSLADALNAIAQGETPDLTADSGKTRLAMPKTAIAKRKAEPLPATVMSKGGPQPKGPVTPRKKGGIWIGLGAAVAVLILGVAATGIFFFKDQLFPPLAPATTVTRTVTQGSPIIQEQLPTKTPSASKTPAPSLTPTLPGLPVIGGADLVAFLSENNIWVMGVDGSNLKQISKDGARKFDLQWSPDGNSLYFISGKCIQNVTFPNSVLTTVTCFTNADYLDGFDISPDGTQVAISVHHILYVVPFDLAAIGSARAWYHVRDMKGCFSFGDNLVSQLPAKNARWSNDGKKIAVNVLSNLGGSWADKIFLFDISDCKNSHNIDQFPGQRFTMTGYLSNPIIPYFSWDGQSLFLLNSAFRFESGYLYVYNHENLRGDLRDPFGTNCCYSSATWSPDGNYVLFTYQDLNVDDSKTNLYYVLYGSIGSGATYTPFSIPDNMLQNTRNHLETALRPAK